MSLSGKSEGGTTSKKTQAFKPNTKTSGSLQQERSDSHVSSCVSMKSDWSMDHPPVLSTGDRNNKSRSLQQERSDSHVSSCVSMKSDWSMDHPPVLSTGDRNNESRSLQQERSDSHVSSCVSMKSDWSMDHPPVLSTGGRNNESREHQQKVRVPSGRSTQGHQTDLASIFMLLQGNVTTFIIKELKRFQRILHRDYPRSVDSQTEDEELIDNEEEKDHRSHAREGVLKVTLYFLRKMKQQELADALEKDSVAVVCQRQLKRNLKKKSQCIYEGIVREGNPAPLNQIYTDLYITEGWNRDVNTQHEVRQIETAHRKPVRPETQIECNNIFKSTPGRDKPIRTVLTKGVAGIGKTVSIQKFTLDWSEEKANQNILFTFPIAFRELNLLGDKEYTMIELLYTFFNETKESKITDFNQVRVVIIFDGLDECRFPLDFQNNEMLTDATKSTSVGVLLTNLIKGNLLPSARLWITTRPVAANLIPPECVDLLTEVRGFNDQQKQKFFMKRFSDKNLAIRIFSHIKKSRSLHIMCHIPVFCFITATVLEHMLTTEQRAQLPITLTEMYIHFMLIQSIRGRQKSGRHGAESHFDKRNKEIILSLGKLAFQELEKGRLIFYEADLNECNIKDSVVSMYLAELFREERGLYQNKMFCFVHLTIQEFLAALYVFLSFFNSHINLLSGRETKSNKLLKVFKPEPVLSFYQSAVKMALHSEKGHWDMFLRFLLGLSTNQTLLQGLLTQTGSSSETNESTAKYIKEKLSENLSQERSINLFHCLKELNDRSLEEDIQQYLRSGSLAGNQLSPSQWSALVFVLLTSEEELDVFDLKKYSASEEGLFRLLPVVKASTTALLSECNLSAQCCAWLASALNSTDLSILDLSHNDLQDAGMQLLSVGLGDPLCKLQALRMSGCSVTAEGCAFLATALKSNPSHLMELDLSNNDLQDSGVQLLAAELAGKNCKLKTLRLSSCLLTSKACSSLACALESNPSHLRELDLSYNHPGQKIMRQLSVFQKDPDFKLNVLKVEHCGEFRVQPGPRRHACDLTLDANTAHRNLSLSQEGRKVSQKREDRPFFDNPEVFQWWKQLLCREGLVRSRWYWEVQWNGWVSIGVTYGGINRKGQGGDSLIGSNEKSWSLECKDNRYTACHNKKKTPLSVIPSGSTIVGVYLDCPGGTLSFYRVSSDTLTLLHTFHSTFTKPLYPGFGVWDAISSVCLCRR